jgi:hypothetical protein
MAVRIIVAFFATFYPATPLPVMVSAYSIFDIKVTHYYRRFGCLSFSSNFKLPFASICLVKLRREERALVNLPLLSQLGDVHIIIRIAFQTDMLEGMSTDLEQIGGGQVPKDRSLWSVGSNFKFMSVCAKRHSNEKIQEIRDRPGYRRHLVYTQLHRKSTTPVISHFRSASFFSVLTPSDIA